MEASPPAADLAQRRLANLRDLGGLRVADGRSTRNGVLYRSDAPFPGDLDPEVVPVWPPSCVVDLRSSWEVRSAHPWAAVASVLNVPLLEKAAVVDGATAQTSSTASERTRLEPIYREILDRVPEKLASLVSVAAESNGPMLVHCAAGKDRTGIAVAVLLLAADVLPREVVDDYAATSSNMVALLSRREALGRPVPATVPRTLLGTCIEAVTAVTDRLVGWPGGPTGWLLEHGTRAHDISAWRRRFVLPA